MLKKPRFCEFFKVELIESEGVCLITESNLLVLNDQLYRLLAPLIDGQRTTDQIIDELLPSILPENPSMQDLISINVNIYYALMQMEQKGYIVESDDPAQSLPVQFCEDLQVNLKQAYHRLQTTKVSVTAFGFISPLEFIATLESLQIKVSEEENVDVDIVLTDNYLREEISDFNQKALQYSRPWMLVKPVGNTIWIGPIFYPGKTGCWACLAHRLRENRPIEGFIQRRKATSVPLILPQGSLASIYQTAFGIAATEVFKWIVQGENKQLEATLVTHNTLALETQSHVLTRRPQCLDCGRSSSQFNVEPLPIILGSRKKKFTADGGHRYCSPEETLKKYHHHISPITGVVRELKKVPTGSNHLNHTYIAKHHFVTIFDDLKTLKQNIEGRSAGKGKTDLQARASGFCEAIERYSGVFQGNEIRRKDSYKNIKEEAIHPNACMNFSQTQYQHRQEWNQICPSWFQKVPEPFDENKEIDWTPIWSLTNQAFKYLPTAYCYYGYQQSPKPECWADSNGCAAGNTIEEAILQGFMELVERDSVALWWYNQTSRPGVDLASFNEPYFEELKQYYELLNRELWVLDITSDLNIPTFAAISRSRDRKTEDIILGYGAHFEAKIAISRALTEANQILPSVLAAHADGSTQYAASADSFALDWWQTATTKNQPYLAANKNAPLKGYKDYSQSWSDDLLEDVLHCQQIVQKHDMEMLVLDQTRPDIGLKVVKVIVPGMRHMWKRLGPGRLYQVPVKLGWLKEPLIENQLNPIPMWM